jgi:heat-inducible transcriptional repressor
MPRPRLEGLTPRRLAVLGAIVREYVATGVPASSERLKAKYGLGASAATIRNDMAALQALGYVEQPYPSGGRRPTARGYRAYVEQLGAPRLPSAEMVWLRAQLRRVRSFAEAVVAATRALAELTRLPALASLPASRPVRLASLVVRRVSGQAILLRYQLTDGTVGELFSATDKPVREDLLQAWQQALEGLGGQDLEALAVAEVPAGLPAGLWRALVEDMLARTGASVVVEGAQHLAAQPEFRDAAVLADLFTTIQHPPRVYRLLAQARQRRGPHALIGSHEALGLSFPCGLVVECFGPAAPPWGRIAALGPMRMDYARTIAAACEAATLLDQAWQAAQEDSSEN